jgi:radical SAM protein with 4Fe4S-binding SPASM domain
MILLPRTGAEALIDAGITTLEVSTSGFDPGMYRRVYRSKMHDKVYKAIIDFAEANNARGRPVRFRIAMRIDRPRAEVVSTDRYKRIDELVGSENITINQFFDNWAGKIRQADLTGTMTLRGQAARDKLLMHLRRPRISACTEMYSGPMVYWDGRVGACACRDVNASELIIGNVNERHLADIWFGPEIQKLRDEFLTGNVRDICRACTHYNNLSHLLRKSSADVLQKALARERRATSGRSAA